jgi:cell division protein DivIC
METARNRKLKTLNSNYISKHEDKQQEMKKQRQGLYRRLLVLGLFTIILSTFIITTTISQAKVIEEKRAEKGELEQRYADLQKQEVLYKEKIVKLNDEEYVAKLARNEYFLSEEGEIIFKLPSDSHSPY